MAKRGTGSRSKAKEDQTDTLLFRDTDDAARQIEPDLHIYHCGAVCDTDTKGYPTPENRSPTELVVDASEGFIPLWDIETTLRWRFNEHAMLLFQNPEAAKAAIRVLLGEAVLAWRDAAPVRFTERHDAWDFEVVVRAEDKCTINGCTLASAFFPDPGRHELVIYPRMFSQVRAEQVETLAHKLGHIFGLRHFFADVSETAWPVEVFGEHNKFSIMNYGPDSRLTETDKSDLNSLYEMAWNGDLTNINGTPVRLMKPFSHFRQSLTRDEFSRLFPV